MAARYSKGRLPRASYRPAGSYGGDDLSGDSNADDGGLSAARRAPSMSAQGPPSPSDSWTSETTGKSSKLLVDYDANDVVHLLLARVGLEQYSKAFIHNGIDGQTLGHLDHETLREIGITSVGKRLALLRIIYESKKSEGLPLEEGDWLPPFVAQEPPTAKPSPPPVYTEHRCDAAERCAHLEREVTDLRDQVDALEVLVHALAGRFIDSEKTVAELKRSRPRSNPLHKPVLSVDTARAAKPVRAATSPVKVKTPDSATLKPSLLRTSPPLPDEPKSSKVRKDYFDDALISSPLRSAARSGRIFDSEIKIATPMLDSGNSSAPPAAPTSAHTPGTTTSSRPSGPTRSNSSRSSKPSSSNDTCVTILPAAVRKYRLKSPWTEYVMIVSCARHKRALSYDERPRLVVEELRSMGESPSCLVQHSLELRSPLALAHSRRSKAFKRLLNAGSESSDELFPQNIPLPAVETDGGASGAPYALAIYPYQAESNHETDVDYGMVYSMVQKDPKVASVQRVYPASTGLPQNGSVPLHCLLQLHRPPETVAPSPGDKTPHSTSSRAIARSIEGLDPNNIASPFASCLALIDRTTHGAGELGLLKGDKLRVYFRCAHWSFVSRDREAGWVPSWLVSTGASSISAREVPQLPTRKPSR